MNTSAIAGDVSFIGVGAIGLPMASRLSARGFNVTAVDPSADRQVLARKAGMDVVPSIEEATSFDTVVAMVATAEQLVELLTAPGGLFDRMKPGGLCVVMSTVGPDSIEPLAVEADRRGIDLLDAPVTGGVPRAEAGTLTILTAGPAHVLERSRMLLESMGTPQDCGDRPGQGQSFKLVNQLLCSVHLVAAAEALAFSESLGLDPATVYRTVAAGAGSSWMLLDRGPRMLDADGDEVCTALDIFVKDSDLVAHAVRTSGFEAPLLSAANNAFRIAAELGLGRSDDSRVKAAYGSRHLLPGAQLD
ncbi:NAD(P)-dependent oxidoreductase [Rhodococcus sp. WS4]|nr:NAD(P)-dependent oxidoreductase [Rhodococcus sp. WS4]